MDSETGTISIFILEVRHIFKLGTIGVTMSASKTGLANAAS